MIYISLLCYFGGDPTKVGLPPILYRFISRALLYPVGLFNISNHFAPSCGSLA